MLARGGADPGDSLTFAAADLTSDEGWSQAVSGCDFVLHVASPFPTGVPKDGATVDHPPLARAPCASLVQPEMPASNASS